MPVGMDFPAMTLLTNLVGALVIGAITELAAIHGTSGAFFALLENGILRRLYDLFNLFPGDRDPFLPGESRQRVPLYFP